MYIVEFASSLIVLILGICFYLYKISKTKKNNNIEDKIKLYKHLKTIDKLAVVIISLFLIGVLYFITIINPQPYLVEFIFGVGALAHGLRAYFEWKYEKKSNRHKLSVLNSGFLLFMLIFWRIQYILV